MLWESLEDHRPRPGSHARREPRHRRRTPAVTSRPTAADTRKIVVRTRNRIMPGSLGGPEAALTGAWDSCPPGRMAGSTRSPSTKHDYVDRLTDMSVPHGASPADRDDDSAPDRRLLGRLPRGRRPSRWSRSPSPSSSRSCRVRGRVRVGVPPAARPLSLVGQARDAVGERRRPAPRAAASDLRRHVHVPDPAGAAGAVAVRVVAQAPQLAADQVHEAIDVPRPVAARRRTRRPARTSGTKGAWLASVTARPDRARRKDSWCPPLHRRVLDHHHGAVREQERAVSDAFSPQWVDGLLEGDPVRVDGVRVRRAARASTARLRPAVVHGATHRPHGGERARAWSARDRR